MTNFYFLSDGFVTVKWNFVVVPSVGIKRIVCKVKLESCLSKLTLCIFKFPSASTFRLIGFTKCFLTYINSDFVIQRDLCAFVICHIYPKY